jgi:hypothetical protein
MFLKEVAMRGISDKTRVQLNFDKIQMTFATKSAILFSYLVSTSPQLRPVFKQRVSEWYITNYKV